MNPPGSHPAALETAFLAIRRMDARLAEMFIEALTHEENILIGDLLLADASVIQQAQGAASMIRTLRYRLEHAEATLAADANRAAAHKKGQQL